jgi:hypothetical protein
MSEQKGQVEQIADLCKRVKHLEYVRDKGDCYHEWVFGSTEDEGRIDATIWYKCRRCGSRQRRRWDDLSAEHVAALKVLGIWRRTRKDFPGLALTVADVAALANNSSF